MAFTIRAPTVSARAIAHVAIAGTLRGFICGWLSVEAVILPSAVPRVDTHKYLETVTQLAKLEE